MPRVQKAHTLRELAMRAAPAQRGVRPRSLSRAYALPCSPLTLLAGLVAVLGVSYVALIAVVMSYASLTVNFAQSVRDNEALVAGLEARYLAAVSEVTAADYASEGYAKPARVTFVPAARQTAVR